MNFTGLSLDQAPPIQSVLRFFLTAPFFAIAASITLFFIGSDEVLTLSSPKMIALIHLFTLGFMMMIIFGALQQMLPVIAGVSLPWAAKKKQEKKARKGTTTGKEQRSATATPRKITKD